MDREERSFGVFKPEGHVVISFPSAAQADAAQAALQPLALPADELRRYSDAQMLARLDEDLAHASPLAALGQEMNLAKAQRELAARGYHWLVVKAGDDEFAQRIAAAVRPHGAERAQLYGRFLIEELIEHPGDLPQVAESPDRGLDAQTRSGEEGERADLRPPEDPPR
ncbi:hypothetical protein [Rubrivivax gelatinosus]|uniref:Uncharacterized protein n=1 Tax=Rubrivivax gelatinosus TaxID=28068 RepID=A0A4V2SHB2_RUBGE|nr:hypothetical protein [Rubrivivax gelatinosus]MBK1686408.1 hypothetical protein [Rubrivivax gelatinosus]TCP04368.1 hypothetical protein EV684_102121 [Rubrivivax gelatinosus]